MDIWRMKPMMCIRYTCLSCLTGPPSKGRGWKGHYLAKSDKHQLSNSFFSPASPSVSFQSKGLQFSSQAGILYHQFLSYIS